MGAKAGTNTDAAANGTVAITAEGKIPAFRGLNMCWSSLHLLHQMLLGSVTRGKFEPPAMAAPIPLAPNLGP